MTLKPLCQAGSETPSGLSSGYTQWQLASQHTRYWRPYVSLMGSSTIFSRITFQVKCFHSNPCLASGSGKSKLKQMEVISGWMRGLGRYCSPGPFSGVLNPCPSSGEMLREVGSGSLAGCLTHSCSLPSLTCRTNFSIRQKGALGRKTVPQSPRINQDWSTTLKSAEGRRWRDH